MQNLTASVLAAINATAKHPPGHRTLLARFEGQLKADPRDNILPTNQTVCLDAHGDPMLFSGPCVWANNAILLATLDVQQCAVLLTLQWCVCYVLIRIFESNQACSPLG